MFRFVNFHFHYNPLSECIKSDMIFIVNQGIYNLLQTEHKNYSIIFIMLPQADVFSQNDVEE